jgi:hypothetical protein
MATLSRPQLVPPVHTVPVNDSALLVRLIIPRFCGNCVPDTKPLLATKSCVPSGETVTAVGSDKWE